MLPVVPFEARPRPSFLPPAEDPVLPGYRSLEEGTISGYGEIARIERDTARASTRVIAPGGGATQYPWGTERFSERIVHEAQDADPALASMRGEYAISIELEGRSLRFESDVEFRSDRENFHFIAKRRLLEDGKLVREKTWPDTIPRDHQ